MFVCVAFTRYSAYLSRSPFRESVVTLKRIVARLRGTSEDMVEKRDSDIPHFIDAYEAEGLLGVCVFIIKVRYWQPLVIWISLGY